MVKSDHKLQEVYQQIQGQFVEKLSNGRGVFGHPGTKGEVSEAEWIALLGEYLPHRYKVNRAFVMDHGGNVSDQIDLVIYDSHFTPRLYSQQGSQFIPAESVYAVFEVKQNLSRENITYAQDKAQSVRKLIRTSSNITHAGGTFEARKPPEIIAGILTYESDYSPAISETAMAHLKNTDPQKILNLGCVASSTSFTFEDGNFIQTDKLPIAMFFMNFLRLLQKMGSVPAINYTDYLNSLNE